MSSPLAIGAVSAVLRNLLDNGLQYTPPGGRVRVRILTDASRPLVSIENDGPGIDPQHLPHVFERFFRVESSRSRATGGSGLGLAICKSIVDSLGGEIRLENRPGGGTVASVSLPASRANVPAPSHALYASTSSSADTLTTSAART